MNIKCVLKKNNDKQNKLIKITDNYIEKKKLNQYPSECALV